MLKKVTLIGCSLLAGFGVGLLVGQHLVFKEFTLCLVMVLVGGTGGMFIGFCVGKDIGNDCKHR